MAKLTRQSLSRARDLRRRMTDAESIVWSRLSLRAGHGIKFRRQHPIGPYFADFVCIAARLVIEIDGETHGSEAEQSYDDRRTAYLGREGWKVVRITNRDVYKQLNDTLDRIFRMVTDRIAAR